MPHQSWNRHGISLIYICKNVTVLHVSPAALNKPAAPNSRAAHLIVLHSKAEYAVKDFLHGVKAAYYIFNGFIIDQFSGMSTDNDLCLFIHQSIEKGEEYVERQKCFAEQ